MTGNHKDASPITAHDGIMLYLFKLLLQDSIFRFYVHSKGRRVNNKATAL